MERTGAGSAATMPTSVEVTASTEHPIASALCSRVGRFSGGSTCERNSRIFQATMPSRKALSRAPRTRSGASFVCTNCATSARACKDDNHLIQTQSPRLLRNDASPRDSIHSHAVSILPRVPLPWATWRPSGVSCAACAASMPSNPRMCLGGAWWKHCSVHASPCTFSINFFDGFQISRLLLLQGWACLVAAALLFRAHPADPGRAIAH